MLQWHIFLCHIDAFQTTCFFPVIITEFLVWNCYFDKQKVMKCAWWVGGDLTASTSPVATPIIVGLWTWCNDCNTAIMLIAIPVCFLCRSIYGLSYICNPCVWMSRSIVGYDQQTCYCDMLTLNNYIFCSSAILKWHKIMLTLQNYAIFTICQYNILCHFNISFFTVFTVIGSLIQNYVTNKITGDSFDHCMHVWDKQYNLSQERR